MHCYQRAGKALLNMKSLTFQLKEDLKIFLIKQEQRKRKQSMNVTSEHWNELHMTYYTTLMLQHY